MVHVLVWISFFFLIYLIYLYVCRKIFEVKFYNGGTSDNNDVANKSINTRYNYDEKIDRFMNDFRDSLVFRFYECVMNVDLNTGYYLTTFDTFYTAAWQFRGALWTSTFMSWW